MCAPGSQADASGATLLYLGTGGPENLEDAGRLDRLTWRYYVIDHPEFGELVLAFTNMVGVMSVTREVNGRVPFSLPTECRRDSAADAVSGARVVVDATADQIRALLSEGRADYRTLADPGTERR